MALANYLRQLGVERVDVRLYEAGGARLEVTSCGEGDRLAVLLHGFPEEAYSWRHQVPLLLEMGYKVWVPNLRGYGRSEKPRGRSKYTIQALLSDIAGLIDIAQPSDVVLIGHDWGGILAWEFAIRRIRPIDKLIVMNAPHPALFTKHLQHSYQLMKSWYVFFFQLPVLPEMVLGANDAKWVGNAILGSAVDKSRFSFDDLYVYRDNATRPGALTAMLNYYRANFAKNAPKGMSTREFAPIDVPTLVIWGEEDVALDIRLTEGMDELVTDLTFNRLANVSHWVQQEAPEAVNKIMHCWLGEVDLSNRHTYSIDANSHETLDFGDDRNLQYGQAPDEPDVLPVAAEARSLGDAVGSNIATGGPLRHVGTEAAIGVRSANFDSGVRQNSVQFATILIKKIKNQIFGKGMQAE